MAAIPTIHPCLWFATGIQEAVDYYIGTFPGSRITGGLDSSEPIPSPAGEPVVITFELCGAPMMAINGGGKEFPFSEAVSLVLSCDGQDEIDHYWNELTSGGGQESVCGWLRTAMACRGRWFPPTSNGCWAWAIPRRCVARPRR